MSELAAMFSDGWYLWLRTARSYLRQPVWIVVAITQPVVWLTLYGQLFRRVVEIPGFGAASYIQFLTPGVVGMTALFNSVWAGFDLLEDMNRGVLDRFLSTPVRRGAIILASVGYAAVAIGVQVCLILVLGSLLGARLEGGLPGVLVTLAACLLLSAGFAAFSNGISLLLRRREPMIAAINFLTLPLAFLSVAFMPAGLMPPWMQAVSRFNPLNWTVEVVRYAFSPTIPWAAAAGGLGKLLAFALVLYLFAQWSFGRYRRRS